MNQNLFLYLKCFHDSLLYEGNSSEWNTRPSIIWLLPYSPILFPTSFLHTFLVLTLTIYLEFPQWTILFHALYIYCCLFLKCTYSTCFTGKLLFILQNPKDKSLLFNIFLDPFNKNWSFLCATSNVPLHILHCTHLFI